MPEIEIYKGAYLSYQSERATLNALLQILSAKQCDAVIIANAELGGRQIDFIVAMEKRAWLIEAKSANSPLRGTANGPWQYQVAAGGWKNFDNPYRQAVDAKNALRDEMRRHCGSEPSYIDAVVAFAPGIPTGSSIFYGDFKASVLGLGDLHEAFRGPQKDHWPLDQWRSFVKVNGFSRVENPEATFDPHMSSAEGIIAEYLAAFRATYEPVSHAYFSYAAKADEGTRDLDDWIQRGASGDCLFFHGPSGCGKSVLGYRISLRALECGRLPIVLQGKNFDGDFGALVNAELGLLDVPSAQALFRATRILNYPIVLVVDGYNECDIRHREHFLRGIAALSRRYKSNVVVSSQRPIEENNRLNLQSVFVPPPDMSVKRSIAEHYAAGHSIDDVIDLLASVLSGLEARLVGEVGRTLGPGASKFQLFDAFVRQRLRAHATRGIAALRRVGERLSSRECLCEPGGIILAPKAVVAGSVNISQLGGCGPKRLNSVTMV